MLLLVLNKLIIFHREVYFTEKPIKDEIYKKLYKIIHEAYYKRTETIYRSSLNLKDRNIYNFMVKIRANDPELYKLLTTSREDRLGEEARGNAYRRVD